VQIESIILQSGVASLKYPVAHIPVERLLGPHVDLHPEQFLKILNQPGVIHQAPARFPSHQ